MPIVVRCSCGRVLKAREEFAGTRAECPTCGQIVQIPLASGSIEPDPVRLPGEAEPTPISDFFDPPQRESRPQAPSAAASTVATPAVPVMRRMFEALLDPRSIQWMLMIGGGLCVLGIIVWLVSKGVFENKLVLAALLGVGTLAILGAGWFVALRTRYRVAGQALTFLGCVVAPLNLWFYHAQNLVTLDGHLWVGGVVCCLLYAATVYVLRDPLFMYACEAGVTLTALLLLADLNKITDATWFSLFLMALGLISIHAERAFSPAEDADFPRRRYGLPLFWSGHAQLGVALIILLASQLLGWLLEPARQLFDIQWTGNPFTQHHLLAAAVWLAAVYAYLYSDIVVRRVGYYLALAGFSLVMAEVTLLLGFHVDAEWIIAAMALTSVGINLAAQKWAGTYKNLERVVPPLAFLLGAIPVLWGVVLHMRATSEAARELDFGYTTERPAVFVAVMLVVAVANRVSAFLTRGHASKSSPGYFFLSAAAVMVAAAGLLRQMNLVTWSEQAPWMMLIPIAYMIASRLWRGHTAERPLYWVAQTCTAVVLLHVFGATMDGSHSFAPTAGVRDALTLGLVFLEAAVFYVLAAAFHRRGINVHLAAASACGALWQLMGYFGVDPAYYNMLYAALGVGCLLGARAIGLETTDVYRFGDSKAKAIRGRGLPAFQSGNAILCVALLASFMQGLSSLVRRDDGWIQGISLLATVGAAGFAAVIVPAANWRRFYSVAATALTAVLFLWITVNVLDRFNTWQKLEIFSTAIGAAILVASHLAKFRETEGNREEAVSFGLALGSVLAVGPLLVAVLYHRWVGGAPSWWDEIALLTVTILMTVTGLAWQIKATTMWGGSALVLYLVVMIAALAYHPQVAIGVYLAVGGAAVFALGIALSMYREKLLALPERVANREGIFRILNWR